MARLALFILTSLFSISSFAQKITVSASIENKIAAENNDTIYYDVKRPLTWNDFKGVPDYNHPGGAITSSGFAFNAQMNMQNNDVNLIIHVYTFFSKKNSWKKTNINSNYHLLHEQHHFDITRISAEKFYHELLKADFTISNYNKLLTALFDKSFNENNLLQRQYDTETNHSINTAEQLRWNSKIEREVSLLP